MKKIHLADLKESLRLNSKQNFWFDLEHFFAFSTCPKAIKAFQCAVAISSEIILSRQDPQPSPTPLRKERNLKDLCEEQIEELRIALQGNLNSSLKYQVEMVLRDADKNLQDHQIKTTSKRLTSLLQKIKG